MQTVVCHLVFEGLDAADAYAVDHAYALLVDGVEVYLAVFDGLLGSYDGELCVAVHLACLFAVDEIVDVKSLHLAGELGLEVGCVKACDGCCSALSGEQVGPCLLGSVAYGGNGAYACYDYSFKFHSCLLCVCD